MSDAWGRAWGESWGLSWGLTYEANQEDLLTGGIGHGKGKKNSHVWLERDGKILLFKNATEAAKFVSAEKTTAKEAEKKPIASDSKGLQQDDKPLDIPKPQVIYFNALERLLEQFKWAGDISQMLRDMEFDALLLIQKRAFEREEDDIEALLLTL